MASTQRLYFFGDNFLAWLGSSKSTEDVFGSKFVYMSWMPQFAERCREPEIMDDPGLDSDAHARALRGLARVHFLTGTGSRLWKPIRSLLQSGDAGLLTVMDVGCGDGLLLRQIGLQARRMGKPLRLVGCDFSQRALEMCGKSAASRDLEVETVQLDVTRDPLPEADVIVNSLFLHHFSESDVQRLLTEFSEKATRLVLIEDLIRSRLGYALCQIGVRLVTRSPVVHVDGPLSVRAAFRVDEMRRMLAEIGLPIAKVSRHWPERFLVEIQNSAEPVQSSKAAHV